MRYILLFLILFYFASCMEKPTAIDIDSLNTPPSSETGTVTDIDGTVYQTVKIGDQWWMSENLKVTHYRNGDAIPNVTDKSAWDGLSTCAYCVYNNDAGNVSTYGLLYNWYSVVDSRNIAPVGWHVPTDEEWKQLEMYLGMSQSDADSTSTRGTDEGSKLKATSGWYDNGNGTNESGFKALPGGYRTDFGNFTVIGQNGFWWAFSDGGSNSTWYRTLGYSYSAVYRDSSSKQTGFSVRLVRD